MSDNITSIDLMERLSEIQLALKAPKSERNDYAKFDYRTCEGIFEAVKPLLKDCTLILSDDVVLVGDRVYVKATATIYYSAFSHSVSAFARESLTKKGMDDSQITGTASSYARKYALNGLFLIDASDDIDSMDNSQPQAPVTQAAQSLTASDLSWIKAVRADSAVLETITDPAYRAFIQKEAAK